MNILPSSGAPKVRVNWKVASWLLVVIGTVILFAANFQLVHLAFRSQPDCMPHLRSAGENGTFRAAQSSC